MDLVDGLGKENIHFAEHVLHLQEGNKISLKSQLKPSYLWTNLWCQLPCHGSLPMGNNPKFWFLPKVLSQSLNSPSQSTCRHFTKTTDPYTRPSGEGASGALITKAKWHSGSKCVGICTASKRGQSEGGGQLLCLQARRLLKQSLHRYTQTSSPIFWG